MMSVYRSCYDHILLMPACFAPCVEARVRYGRLEFAGAESSDGWRASSELLRRIDRDIDAHGYAELDPPEWLLLHGPLAPDGECGSRQHA